MKPVVGCVCEPEIFNSRKLQITNGSESTKQKLANQGDPNLREKQLKLNLNDKRAHVDCPDHVHWDS